MEVEDQFLLSWPRNQVGESSDFTVTSLQEVCMALSAMSKTVTGVLEVLSSSKVVKLEEQKRKLDERRIALKALLTVPKLDGTAIAIDDPYLAVGSLAELLNALISQGAFKSVERLQQSEWGNKLSPEVVASSALRIPVSIDPRSYIPWLCDLVIPSLSIGHPLLDYIRAWSCRTADRYDEADTTNGLDSSIAFL